MNFMDDLVVRARSRFGDDWKDVIRKKRRMYFWRSVVLVVGGCISGGFGYEMFNILVAIGVMVPIFVMAASDVFGWACGLLLVSYAETRKAVQ